jgi:hypothetical protein
MHTISVQSELDETLEKSLVIAIFQFKGIRFPGIVKIDASGRVYRINGYNFDDIELETNQDY